MTDSKDLTISFWVKMILSECISKYQFNDWVLVRVKENGALLLLMGECFQQSNQQNIINHQELSSLPRIPFFNILSQGENQKCDQRVMYRHVSMCAKPLQSCLTLCNSVDCSLLGSSIHEDSPGKNPGVGCHVLLQGIFVTQGSSPCLLTPVLAGGFFTTSTTWESTDIPQKYCGFNSRPLQ